MAVLRSWRSKWELYPKIPFTTHSGSSIVNSRYVFGGVEHLVGADIFDQIAGDHGYACLQLTAKPTSVP